MTNVKKILTLFAMALMVISVNAQILIAEKDWSGVSDNALPWIKFADPANGSAKGGADGIEINVTKVANQWEPQGNVCEGFDLTAGASYRVVIVAKVGSSSDVAIQMGGWDNWLKKSIHVDATGDFQEIVCDFSNYSYDVENAHVLFLCGHTLGSSIVKKIEVFRVINKKRAVHVSTAGTLPQLITNSEKSQIEELTLTGYLNGTDIACIRRMAGYAVNYDYDNGSVVEEMENNQIYRRLYILDISGATIVSGGSAYMQVWHGWPSDAPVYTDLELSWYTSDNTISEYMFNGCKFAKVSLPNNIKRIENYAFGNNLTEIVIPQSVTSIGSQAFSRGSGLTSVKVESGNKNYDSRNNCNAIIETSSNKLIFGCKNTVIPNSVTSIGNYAFEYCSGLTSVTIPNSVTSIGDYAFRECSGLTSVTIPNSVTSIGNDAFYKCSLTSIKVESGNQKYDSRNNCNAIIESSSNTLIIGCKNTIIPNSVTSIGSSAFSHCSGLTSVTIPNSVTSIGKSAFMDCSGLTSVTIPNSVTSIGDFAFIGCSGLTSILSLNNTPPTCEISFSYNNSFSNVDKENCVLWVPKGSVSAYKTADGWKDFQNIRELTFCDVNLDEEVNQADLDATVDFIMGKDPEDFFESLADLNGDDVVDAADVVKLLTILNLQEGLNMDYQAKYSNQVISSLSCTLNNDGDKAIQLTKCELYCNHSVVSSSKFKVTLAKGESKKCSFDELESLSSITGFSVVWYYTYNGEDYTYRCEIEE